MSVLVPFNGTNYLVPTSGETGWATNVTNLLSDLGNNAIPKGNAVISTGSVNAVPIGNLTPSTGSFTTLIATNGTIAVSSLTASITAIVPTAAPGNSSTNAASTAFVGAAVATAIAPFGRNLFHNSMDRVQQRGTGPWTTNLAYMTDRWLISSVGGETYSCSVATLADADRTAIGDQEAVSALAFTYAACTTVDFHKIQTRVEGVRSTAAKTVTVSFYAKAASGTPTLTVNYGQVFGSGGSPSANVVGPGSSVILTTTLARYFVNFTIPTATGKTFGTTAGTDFTYFDFIMSSGPSVTVGPGSQSGTITIYGRQLEIGSVATALEKKDLQTDVAQCQRFYFVSTFLMEGYGVAGTSVAQSSNLPVMLHIGPTSFTQFTTGSQSNTNLGGVNMQIMAPIAGFPSTSSVWVSAAVIATGNWILCVPYTLSVDL